MHRPVPFYPSAPTWQLARRLLSMRRCSIKGGSPFAWSASRPSIGPIVLASAAYDRRGRRTWYMTGFSFSRDNLWVINTLPDRQID